MGVKEGHEFPQGVALEEGGREGGKEGRREEGRGGGKRRERVERSPNQS